MPSPALYRPVASGPLTCSSTRSIGRRPLDTRPLTSEILAGMTVVGATGEKPPPGAGTTQCGDGDVGVIGGEGVAEGQREKHAEWRAALRLRIEQAGEEHRFRCRLSPPDRLAAPISRVKSSASGAMGATRTPACVGKGGCYSLTQNGRDVSRGDASPRRYM